MRAVMLALLLLTCVGQTQGVAAEKVWRVGLLSNGPSPRGTGRSWRDGLVDVLSQNGFELGKNVEIVDRYSEGYVDKLPQLAGEINLAGVDVIMAISSPSVRAVFSATSKTPIVSIGSDPVVDGFADSFAHPGGRVTGMMYQTTEADPKRLQLLIEAIPSGRHFGYLGMSYQLAMPLPEEMAHAAEQLGVKLTTRWIEDPAAYGIVFSEMKSLGVAGVVVGANQPLASDALRVAASATEHGLPTICEWEYMARAGCVLSYGHDLAYDRQRAGEYVVRILQGALPAELPVERSDA